MLLVLAIGGLGAGCTDHRVGDCAAFEAGYRKGAASVFKGADLDTNASLATRVCRETKFSETLTACVGRAGNYRDVSSCFGMMTDEQKLAMAAARRAP